MYIARMDNTDQLGFDFLSVPADGLEMPHDPQERGYQFFVKDREDAMARLKKRFNVMLNEPVRLKLFGWDQEFTGKLKLNTLLIPESKKDDVPLRLGRVKFDLRDIEYCFCTE